MSILAKELKVPSSGLKYEVGPEMIEELFTPRSLNVHEVNSEIRTKPGLSYFETSDTELELFLHYSDTTLVDGLMELRKGANDNMKLSQSITTPGASRTVDKISLYLKRVGTITAGKVISLTVETDSTGPSGTAVTNGTSANVLATSIGTDYAWIEFTFATPMTLDSATKYWIVLQGDYDVSASNYIAWGKDGSSSTYTDGEGYVFDSSWAAVGSNEDFLFKMYRDATMIMLIDTFYLTSGTKYLIIATLDRLFYWNTATSEWNDITGYAAANMFTGTVDDGFSSDTYAATNTFLITNYVNNIKKWTASGFIADLGGTPPRAKFLRCYKDHLLLGYVYDDAADRPYRLSWSDAGDLETWDSGTAGYHDFLEGIDYINGIFFLNDYVVITKERSIYVGYPVTTSYVFQFDLRISGIGPMSGAFVTEKGNELLFAAWDDIYAFNGTDIASIADEFIRQEFFDSTDPQYILRGFSIDMEEVGEWHIYVAASGSTYPDTVWVYSYKDKGWWKYSLQTPVICGGYYEEEEGFTINSIVGTIDQQLWRMDDRTIVGFNAVTLLGTSTGRIIKVNYLVGEECGIGVEAYVDTKDFFFVNESGKRIRGKIQRFWLKASGTKCYVYYSIDQGNSYHILDTDGFTLSSIYGVQEYTFRKQVEHIRFRVYKSAIGESFNLRALGFDVQMGGRL